MIYFFALLLSFSSWGCFVEPQDFPQKVRKEIETQLKKKGFKITNLKTSERVSTVSARSKKGCRRFFFTDSINPDCSASVKLDKETACKE